MTRSSLRGKFPVLLAIGFIVFMRPLGCKKRAINSRDEFIRRVNPTSMARSWCAMQYLVIARIFGTIFHWITRPAIRSLIPVSVFMLVTCILFMIPLYQKGKVE